MYSEPQTEAKRRQIQNFKRQKLKFRNLTFVLYVSVTLYVHVLYYQNGVNNITKFVPFPDLMQL